MIAMYVTIMLHMQINTYVHAQTRVNMNMHTQIVLHEDEQKHKITSSAPIRRRPCFGTLNYRGRSLLSRTQVCMFTSIEAAQ